MSRGFVVRPAEPGDAAALVELGRAVGGEPEGWLLGEEGRGVGEERRFLRSLRRHPHAAAFVAEAPEGIVGRLSVARDAHPNSRHVADLGLLVAASHRRRGIGRALIEAAVEWARGAGIRKLELHVFPHNVPAQALYRSFGFVQEGYRHGHYCREGREIDAILMAYVIPPEVPGES